MKADRRFFFSSSYVQARKGHTCRECHSPILSGQTYLSFVVSKFDREAVCLGCSVRKDTEGKFHWFCEAVRERVKKLGRRAGEQPQAELAL